MHLYYIYLFIYYMYMTKAVCCAIEVQSIINRFYLPEIALV